MPAHRPKAPPTSRDPATHRDLRAHKTLSNRRRKHIDKYFTPLPITPELIAHRLTPAPHEYPDPLPTTLRKTFKEIRRPSSYNRRGYGCKCDYCFMHLMLPRQAKRRPILREIVEGVEHDQFVWYENWHADDLEHDGLWYYPENIRTYWDWVSVLDADPEGDPAMDAKWEGEVVIGSQKFEEEMECRFEWYWMLWTDPAKMAFQVRGTEHVFADAVERAVLIAGLEVEVVKRPWMRPENWRSVEKYFANELNVVPYPHWTMREDESIEYLQGHVVYAVARELWRRRNEDVSYLEIEEIMEEDGEKEWDVVSVSTSIADVDDLVTAGQGEQPKQCIVM